MRNWIFTAATRRERRKNERTNERKKERMYRVAFNTLYFSGTFFPPQFVTVSRYTMRQFQASSSESATYGLRIRIVRPDQIRSDLRGGSINLNVFILCTRFVDTFSTSRNQACACMCMHVQACACCHFQLHIHIQFRWPFCVKSCNFLWQPLNCVRLMTDKPARCF